jgi:membrane-associated phospholipid phosphatase
MRYLLVLFLVSLAFLQTAFCQDSLSRESDLYRFSDAVIYTYTQPARWEKKDFIRAGVLFAGTAAITLIDDPVRDFFQRNRSDFPGEVKVVGYHLGKPYSAFITTGGLYLFGVIFHKSWAKETGIQLGVTQFTSGILQTLSKDLIGRARPSAHEGAYSFRPFSGKPAYHSFLSGHIAISFGTSLVLASRVKNIPAKIFLYSLAACSALSRMNSDDHWLSDIAFGAALAWFCNETASKRLTETSKGKRRGKLGARWAISGTPRAFLVVAKF